MLSLTKTVALGLATALIATAAALPAPQSAPTVGLQRLTVNYDFTDYIAAGCVNADGSVRTGITTFDPNCANHFTAAGSDAAGYTISSSLGPCGFVGEVFKCAPGVAPTTFGGVAQARPVAYVDLSFTSRISIAGSSLTLGPGSSGVRLIFGNGYT